MPYKHNARRRHKFPPAKYRTKNLSNYNNSLKKRGDITLWFSDDAIESWYANKSGKPGGQLRYSDVAIETALIIRLIFHLPLRQTQGFMTSLAKLMGLTILIPDYSTLSRRLGLLQPKIRMTKYEKHTHIIIDSSGLTVFGSGEWHDTPTGKKKFQGYRKLNIAINENQEIVACQLTTKRVGDVTVAPMLLKKVHYNPRVIMADSSYDSRKVYKCIKQKYKKIPSIIIPPRCNGRWRKWSNVYTKERCDHIAFIRLHGRMNWQKKANYGKRSLVEVAFHRYKSIIGHRMRAIKFSNQKAEALLACKAINIMTSLGMPKTERVS